MKIVQSLALMGRSKFNAMAAAAATAVMAMLSGAANAALESRAGGTMLYDSTRNITWLADMNYAKTSMHTGTGVNADGTMTWDAATAWANDLAYGGFSDWRLPTLDISDTSCTEGTGYGVGFNCKDGELSGLFVTDLGYNANQYVGLISGDDTAEQIANLALFSNVSDFYWSGTEYIGDDALAFVAYQGVQDYGSKFVALYAVAVRPGDVTAPVPEPQTLALVLLALGATVVARRRRAA